jgi:hypothetical protein
VPRGLPLRIFIGYDAVAYEPHGCLEPFLDIVWRVRRLADQDREEVHNCREHDLDIPPSDALADTFDETNRGGIVGRA